MEEFVEVKVENGYYLFKLGNKLKDNNISINKIMKDTNPDFKVIKRIMNGDIVKIDIYVLARICDYLNCSIEDLIEYKH